MGHCGGELYFLQLRHHQSHVLLGQCDGENEDGEAGLGGGGGAGPVMRGGLLHAAVASARESPAGSCLRMESRFDRSAEEKSQGGKCGGQVCSA